MSDSIEIISARSGSSQTGGYHHGIVVIYYGGAPADDGAGDSGVYALE